MSISSGGTANSTTVNYSGYMYISSDGVANNTTVRGRGYMVICSGGVANNTIVQSSGYTSGVMVISSGGVANSTTVNSGYMVISSGGTANSTTVNSGGSMEISSGGVANSTTVNSGGNMRIYSGGTALEILENGGWVNADVYANVTFASNTINGITLNTYDSMTVHKNTIANDTTVNSVGRMYIYSGGKHTGTLQMADGADVAAYNGSIIDFTVSDRTVEDDYLINNLSLIKGAPTYTITVSAEQEYGTYKLAQGAENFTGSITIGDGTINYGSITVNGADFVYNNITYRLDQVDGNLTLTVKDQDNIPPAKPTASANITSLTNKDVVVTATFSDDTTVKQYSLNNSTWYTYTSGITMSANGTVYFRGQDAAGNYSDVVEYTVGNIDTDAPIAPIASADITTATNGKVTVSAEFSSDSVVKEYSLNGKDWSAYENGIDFTQNGKVYFRGQDAAGNYSEVVEYTVGNIDKDAPIAPIASADITAVTNGKVTVSATFSNDSMVKEYSLNGKDWEAYEKGIDFFGNGKVYFRGQDAAGNYSEVVEYMVGNIDTVADSITAEYVFISSQYTNKINGKKQNGITLIYGKNAFASLKAAGNTSGKTVILLDSKSSDDYVDQGTVAGVVVVPIIKATDNSYNYKANSAPKGTLNISKDTDSTEFIRFASVNVTGATVGNISGGKEVSSEDTKSAVDKKGTVTDTGKSTYTANATGKFTALNGSAETVSGYATVNLTNASVAELTGGNSKETFNSKLVNGETQDQKTISTVNDKVAAGGVTLKNRAAAEVIEGFSNVTLSDSIAGDVKNFTSKDSKSETATFDEVKNTVTRKVTLSHSETTAGTLKATNSTLGNVTGFATITLQNVSEAGDFSIVSEAGEKYSTVKETLNVKTSKDGSVSGTYNKTETFTRAGKFTATNSTAGDIENFSIVTLDGSAVGDISNFTTAKIVTQGTASWDDMSAYGRPEDYDIDLTGWDLTVTETKSLNGSVTLKNGSHADNVTDFKSVSLTGSEVEKIDNVNKVTVNKGDSIIGSYTGTEDNDTLTIAKNAVLIASKIDLGTEAKDTLAINGTLILTGSVDDLPLVEATKITGKGEIAAVSTIYETLNINHTNILNVGDTAQNFRGTAYENSDDNFKKAVKWDGKEEYNGWLGNWEGYTYGSDMVDHIKFKAAAGDILEICDAITNETLNDQYWVLLDKKGNEINSTDIFDTDGRFMASGEYIIKVETEKNLAYSITLA